MAERRRETRQRVIYGGVVTFDDRRSTVECTVRDFSPSGARIALTGNATIPDHFCLVIPKKDQEFVARLVWCNAHEAGLSFIEAIPASAPSLHHARSRSHHSVV